jgi:DNA-binding response OmpR family regulator
MRILIVEDDLQLAETLNRGLKDENHLPMVAADGREALDLVRLYEFDVVLLDVMLPGLDGFEVARRLRKQHNHVPIVMLTARDTIPDVIKGLDLGADDYLTKPFSFEELLARLRAAARHRPASRAPTLQIADLALDPSNRQVTRAGEQIILSATEYRLLEFLMRRAGRVVTRNALIEGVWGFDVEIESNTLDAFVRLLRNKIDRDFPRKLIRTIRGIGYSISEDTP